MNTARAILILVAMGSSWASSLASANTAGTFDAKQLTLDSAQKAAQAALSDCRKKGAQVAVAVVDRVGTPQVMLRDRFAGAHTPDTAVNKAWTSASFKISTTELGKETEPGKPASGIRHLPRVVTVGGGLMIHAAGTMLGAIGVSGAPNGAMDEACAQAGIKAIADDIEF